MSTSLISFYSSHRQRKITFHIPAYMRLQICLPFLYVNMNVFSCCKILVVKLLFLFLWAGRCWVVQALYRSFCCPSLGVTGLKGPIMI